MNKVKIDLDVFGALMLHQVCREIQCTDIITINECRTFKGNVQLQKQLTKPGGLGNCVSNGTVLSVSTRTGHSGLSLRRPGNQIISKEQNISRRGATSIPPNLHLNR